MSMPVSGRPSLAHLKKQAQQLLSAHRRGDALARGRFAAHLPGYDRTGNGVALHDAQSVIAREQGFPSWQRLRDEVRLRVRLPRGEPERVVRVEAAGETVRPADRHINRILFVPEGGTLLSAGMDGRLREWDPATGAELRAIQAHPKSANTISFHPDESVLATGSTEGTARVWRWPSLESVAESKAKVGASSRFSPLGERVLTVGLNGRAYLWSWPGLDAVADVRVHKAKVLSFAFTPDGEDVLTSALDGSVVRTRLANGESSVVRPPGGAPLLSLAFVPGAGHLLCVEYGHGLRLLTWPGLEPLAGAEIGAGGVYATDFHPSEEVFALCVERGVQIRRNEDLSLLGTLAIPAKGVYSAAFSADDRWLAVAGADQRIRVWRMLEGEA
jgi:WD40 repeat protein